MTEDILSLSDIEDAHQRIAPHVLHTPVVPAFDLSEKSGGDIWLKLETLQATGAFKLRGAINAALCLDDDARAAGIVAVSSGNHGRGLAYAGRKLGFRAIICVSSLVPAVKVEAMRKLGAEVRIIGDNQDAAEEEANRLVREEGMTFVSPFDDPIVMAGQGTIGIELLEDLPDLDVAIVPLSGGGLIAGIACALKALKPSVQVIGVTMERGAAMHESLKAGHPVPVDEYPSWADALGGSIGLDNKYSFTLCRALLDDTVLVSEDEIVAAMRHMYRAQQLVIEGGAAVGVAAVLSGKYDCSGKKAAIVVSGRNVDMDRFTKEVAL